MINKNILNVKNDSQRFSFSPKVKKLTYSELNVTKPMTPINLFKTFTCDYN